MGGIGSGSHEHNKNAVEDGKILNISAIVSSKAFKETVNGNIKDFRGTLNWTCKESGNDLGSIRFYIKSCEGSIFLNLIYNYSNNFYEQEIFMNYDIKLISLNRTNRGSVYLFECPLCKNYKGFKLYNSGSKYFACRKCLDLNYLSSKNSTKFNFLSTSLGNELGLSPKFVKKSLKRLLQK